MFWIVTTLIFVLLQGISSDGINIDNRIDRNYFDVLIFTQHWPATFCYTWKEKNHNNQCILPTPKEMWTIHGIWPTRFHTKGPANCNNSMVFDIEKLKPILSDLEQYWLNIEKGTELDILWKHEWQKHGTCAAQLPELNTEAKYFGQGLTWVQDYSLSNILAQANILPGGSYNILYIYSSLKSALGYNPAISCIKDHVTGNTYLFEIKICFDKELKVTNCDGILGGEGQGWIPKEGGWFRAPELILNCDSEKHIFYPSVVPPTKHDVITETDYDSEPSYLQIPFVKLYKFIKILQWATL